MGLWSLLKRQGSANLSVGSGGAPSEPPLNLEIHLSPKHCFFLSCDRTAGSNSSKTGIMTSKCVCGGGGGYREKAYSENRLGSPSHTSLVTGVTGCLKRGGHLLEHPSIIWSSVANVHLCVFSSDDGDLIRSATSATSQRRAPTLAPAPRSVIEVLNSHKLFDVPIISSVELLKSINSLWPLCCNGVISCAVPP